MVDFWVQLWYKAASSDPICQFCMWVARAWQTFCDGCCIVGMLFCVLQLSSCKQLSLAAPTISAQMAKNSVEHYTAATFYFILHIFPNICNPYMIPEAEIPVNWTVVFRRRPRRHRRTWKTKRGVFPWRGMSTGKRKCRGSRSWLLTSSPKHATWLFSERKVAHSKITLTEE